MHIHLYAHTKYCLKGGAVLLGTDKCFSLKMKCCNICFLEMLKNQTPKRGNVNNSKRGK